MTTAALLDSKAPAAIGQMYVVKVRGVRKDTAEILKACYLVNARSRDEVESKLRYLIDVSPYRAFTISGIDKVKGGLHVVYQSMQQPDDAVDATFVEQTEDGSRAHAARTNQPANRNVFAVTIQATLHAIDDLHVMRKLGFFLGRRGAGIEAKNPLFAASTISIEPVGEGSLEGQQSYENVFKNTVVFRG